MKIKTFSLVLFSVLMIFGLNVVSNAQTNQNDVNKQQKDDNDERDERVSSKERKQLKISLEQARKIALERVGGVIVEEELEKENGVIIYSIEIRREDKKVFDVEVDAQTGVIVKVEEETDDDEDGDDDDDGKPN